MHGQEALAAHDPIHHGGGDLGPGRHARGPAAVEVGEARALQDAPAPGEADRAVAAEGDPGPAEVAGGQELEGVARPELDAADERAFEDEQPVVAAAVEPLALGRPVADLEPLGFGHRGGGRGLGIADVLEELGVEVEDTNGAHLTPG